MKRKSLWIGIGLAGVAAVVLSVAFSYGTDNASSAPDTGSSPQAANGTFDPDNNDWQQNGRNNVYMTQLIKGELGEPATGEVKTDTDCEADEQGISRCHNEVALDNGKTIAVINIHNMKKHPCFSPGDKVKAEATAPDWVQLTKS